MPVGFGFAEDPLSPSPVCEQAGLEGEGEDGGCWDQTANGGCSIGGAGLQLYRTGGRKWISSECSCPFPRQQA